MLRDEPMALFWHKQLGDDQDGEDEQSDRINGMDSKFGRERKRSVLPSP